MTQFWAFFYMIGAASAGLSLAIQQIMNARLRFELGSPWWAGLVSYAGGTLVMITAIVVSRETRPTLGAINAASLPSWSGGLLGAAFIATGIFLVPRLGAATFLAFVVVGQTIGSLAFDHFGLFGLPQHTASPARLIGAAALVVGVALVRL